MRYVLDISVAATWLLHSPDVAKAMRLRRDYIQKVHELLAPDTFLTEAAELLVKGERQGILDPGETMYSFNDLRTLGIVLHATDSLHERAIEIAFATRLTVAACLYLALAESEQCSLLTTNQKVIKKTRKHFNFVVDFATLP